MKEIVIFGAGGNLGRSFVGYLSEQECNFHITAAVHHKNALIEEELSSCADVVEVDIVSGNGFSKLPSHAYAIVDFAGMMPAKMKGYNPQAYIDTNITGTLKILEYCRQSEADRIMYMQSFGDIKNYGDTEIVLTVDMPRNMSFHDDHTIYVLSKNFGVDLLRNYHEMYGIKPFVFRLPNIYMFFSDDGYFLDGTYRRKNQFIMIEKAKNGEPIEVWGNPKRLRDMVYIKDFSQMLYRALNAKIDGGHYNVGTGVGTSMLEQVEGIIKVFGNNNRIVYRPDMPDSPQYIMDIAPATIDLGYKPEYLYLDMLKDMKREMMKKESAGR